MNRFGILVCFTSASINEPNIDDLCFCFLIFFNSKYTTIDTLMILTWFKNQFISLSIQKLVSSNYLIMSIAGILVERSGQLKLGNDGKPLTGLAYTDGPGWYNHRNGSVRKDLNDFPEDDKPTISNIYYLLYFLHCMKTCLYQIRKDFYFTWKAFELVLFVLRIYT